MEDASSVLLSREGGIARVVMNRPEQLNAIDVPMAKRFAQVCQEVAADSSVRVVVISGSGRGFGAGGDLSAFREEPTQAAASIIEHVHAGLLQLTAMNAPVLASVHGVVAGGSLSLMSACDLAIAAEGTRFKLLSWVKPSTLRRLIAWAWSIGWCLRISWLIRRNNGCGDSRRAPLGRWAA